MDIKIIFLLVVFLFIIIFFHKKFKTVVEIVSDVIDDNTTMKNTLDNTVKTQKNMETTIHHIANNNVQLLDEQELIKKSEEYGVVAGALEYIDNTLFYRNAEET